LSRNQVKCEREPKIIEIDQDDPGLEDGRVKNPK
jgi:hypothetical protein